jgi:hypothetical protein
VRKKYGVSNSMILRWWQEFQSNLPLLFADKRNPKQKARAQGFPKGIARRPQTDHRRADGAERDPKKSTGAVGQLTAAQKMELASQLTPPNGPSSKSQVARALSFARASYYWQSSQARKDKVVVEFRRLRDLPPSRGKDTCATPGAGKSDAAKDAQIARLQERVRTLEREVQRLREENALLYGRLAERS